MVSIPTIIVVAYNRPFALNRILYSLSKADYEGYKDVSLCISIDGGGEYNTEVMAVANNFEWAFGEKKIVIHSENKGLRKHIISCGNLIEQYENIIMLEEDCFVSRNFYDFGYKALSYYQNEDKIAGISLYAYNFFESISVPFTSLYDGNDVYFVQVPGSLGQVWTKKQWNGFMDYYKSKPQISQADKLPEKVKTWPESSWKKYFYKYMVEKDLFFVYPQISFSTNFGDMGTHFSLPTQLYQVPLENTMLRKHYSFVDFDDSNNKYDAFFELLPESLIKLGANIDKDTCIDMMGGKVLSMYDNKYALSVKDCKAKLQGYSNALQPFMLNVLFSQEGDFFSYAFKLDFLEAKASRKNELIKSGQTLSFDAGRLSIITGKYYKIGYYLSHPQKILKMINRKFSMTS